MDYGTWNEWDGLWTAGNRNETWSMKCRLKEMGWNMNSEINNVTQETNWKKKKKEEKTAEYCHVLVINSPNNTLQIVLSWLGCSSLRLILSIYFESHKQ